MKSFLKLYRIQKKNLKKLFCPIFNFLKVAMNLQNLHILVELVELIKNI